MSEVLTDVVVPFNDKVFKGDLRNRADLFIADVYRAKLVLLYPSIAWEEVVVN